MNLVTLTYGDRSSILNLLKLTMSTIYDDAVVNLNNLDAWKKRRMWGQWYGEFLMACCGIFDRKWLAYFAVHPDHQRKGWGEEMLGFVLDRTNANPLYVETYLREEFAKANAFYLTHGFVFSGIILPDTIYYKLVQEGTK